MSEKKRCFVISPIGSENSPERKHADDLFDLIIKPAMDRCNVDVFRSDHVLQLGKISDQMFTSIFKEDFAVAVLTFFNPNVFYELALAQAAGRPVILMLEKGQKLPFDIQDLRCVYYDFDPRAVVEGKYVEQIVGHVQSLANSGWPDFNLFEGLSPLGVESRKTDEDFYLKSDNFGTPDTWLGLVKAAETSFDTMGINLASWRRGKGFTETLMSKGQQGCKIRVLLIHSENPCLRELINDAIPEVKFDIVAHEADSMYGFFADIADKTENMEVRRVLRGCPHFQLTITDKRAICIQYLYSQKTGWSPAWDTLKGSPMYDLVAEEFEGLWQANEGN